MEPWYKVITPRREVREGRSFDPKEFAIHLEQVVNGTAPEDYSNPAKFFERTYFTKALREHVGMVLRRLSGETAKTAPVLTLVTQFGGGKTHTLTVLYHLAKSGDRSKGYPGIDSLLLGAGIGTVPSVRVAVFVGSAWDPQEGRENPWLDIARQLAGDDGVRALGESARNVAPGTEALDRLFKAAGGSVLILFDETLNFLNRHRDMSDPFYAFVQNLTIAMTGTTNSAMVMSLPRSQTEMTDWDMEWQEKITKVVGRVAKNLIANEETEISEVIRKRLFENLGDEKVRTAVSKAYADWCFERRNQLPPEWTMVDTASTEAGARDILRKRFEACYPFHPATLSVFQRKWQALPRFQQTRATLAMLAQWVSWAYRDGFQKARKESLITIGSAPLDVADFRASILGQLGDERLATPIETDIAGAHCHAKVLDVDTKDALKDIHRRVGTTILFESSGGMVDKVAHLPEIRFALGEPEVETTSIDNTAVALESRSFFIRKVGTDGYLVRFQPTLKKVVSDRRASLDEEDVKKKARLLVKKEFERDKGSSLVLFPKEGSEIPDSPRLTIVVLDPEHKWPGNSALSKMLLKWTTHRGESQRLYPYSLVWCLKKGGRELTEKVEDLLAWAKVKDEIDQGLLGPEIERTERLSIQGKVKDAEDEAKDEVWASYRYVVVRDEQVTSGLHEIDIGAGHASSAESLYNRIITAMKTEGLLNESVGVGYLQRNWPVAHKESGAWPLSGLRQSFLDGSLTRLVDPEATMQKRIMAFVKTGEYGLATGKAGSGEYAKVWFKEEVAPEDVAFDANTFLLTQQSAKQAKGVEESPPPVSTTSEEQGRASAEDEVTGGVTVTPQESSMVPAAMTISGEIPPEVWNRVGTTVLPKVRPQPGLRVSVEIALSPTQSDASALKSDVEQALIKLGLNDKVSVSIDDGS